MHCKHPSPVVAAVNSRRAAILATSLVTILCLVQFMLLDLFVVRLRPYPAEANLYDWTILLFPLPRALALLMARRFKWRHCSADVLLMPLIAGCLSSVPLIVTVGVWFHFAIGGSY